MWTSGHYAVGMACGGALAGIWCLVRRSGWKWLPWAMTAGGVWALLPDMPRVFREDFPSLPFAAWLGQSSFERWLHSFGNLFAFHSAFDAQPREYALHGLTIILVLYNLSLLMMTWSNHRQAREIRRLTRHLEGADKARDRAAARPPRSSAA